MQPSNGSTPTFYHLGISPKLLQVIERLKFVTPTPIQLKTIPLGIEGKDVVGIAQTGTGKTLAFGIPLVQRLCAIGGKALVLVPTRELALQVDGVLQQLLHPFQMRSVILIGGASMHWQLKMLHKNPKVIIATPGRLIDHLGQRTVNLQDVKTLVIDEADRMFDMGFAPQVERIFRGLPRERQTLLFSATMPSNIVKLATDQMKLPIHVEIAPPGTVAERVTQELYIVREEAKRTLLTQILHQYRGPILIFSQTKIGAKKITRLLRDAGFNAAEIHSDRSMAQRKDAIEGFKAGRYPILVATDIAARGIDVTNIELVMNYDLPEDVENYVHRIGRTGRAGSQGHAISLATPDQSNEVRAIERLIRMQLPVAKHAELTLSSFPAPQSRSFSPGRRGRFGRGPRKSFRR